MGRHSKPPSKLPRRATVASTVVLATGGLTISDSGAFIAASPMDIIATFPAGVPAVVPAAQVTAQSSAVPTAVRANTAAGMRASQQAVARLTRPDPKPWAAKPARARTAAPAAEVADAPAGTSNIVALARQYIGVPYVWGGKTASGLDCSGLVYVVLKKAGLTNSYRTSASLRSWVTPITKAQARAGDLVFGPGHVGIYLGNGKMIDAPQPGFTVGVHNVYSNMYEYGRIPA